MYLTDDVTLILVAAVLTRQMSLPESCWKLTIDIPSLLQTTDSLSSKEGDMERRQGFKDDPIVLRVWDTQLTVCSSSYL